MTDEPDALGPLLRLAGARPPASAEATARIRIAVRGAWLAERESRQRRRALWSALGLAAVLLLVVRFSDRLPSPPVPQTPIATVERVVGPAILAVGTPLGENALLRVGPETRIALRVGPAAMRLDAGTVLRLDSPRRVGLVAGAVYLDAPGAGPSLEIETRFGRLRHVGTQFEARLVADGLRLRVREGRVDWLAGGGALRAEAGEQLSVGPGEVVRSRVPRFGSEWDWTIAAGPDVRIEGRTLAAVAAEVARELGLELRHADAASERSASGIVLHGNAGGLPSSLLLAAVLPTTTLDHRVEGGALWLRSRP